MIVALAALCFIPGLGRLHLFDWDEINFAESAREMLITGDYRDVQIGFQPSAEKPPLFMWVQTVSMRIFGVGEFAARLPNAVVGIISLVCIYLLGRRLFDRRFALWWVVAYAGSLLPNLYFHSGIIDPLFNLLIFAGIAALFAFERSRLTDGSRRGLLLIAGISIGLAVLTKGPVGLLLPGLTWLAFWAVRRREMARPIVPMLIWVMIAGIVAAPWYILVAQQGNRASTGNFINAFVGRQLELLRTGVAGHTGPWYFHFVVLAVGCFPASLFAIWNVKRKPSGDPAQRDFRLWMILLLSIVLVVFSLVQTKIVHYSSLAYFPITFLAAQVLADSETKWSPRYLSIGTGGIGLIWATAFLAMPAAGLVIAHRLLDPASMINDPFLRAALAMDVGWSPVDLLVGGAYLAAIVLALTFLRQQDANRSAATLFIATAIIVPLALVRIAPKIERYTQGTPIAFYESLRGCKCYVAPLGFKSYAHLFYARVSPDHSARAAGVGHDKFEEWLLSGSIDSPAYFVSKVNRADRWLGRPGIEVIAARNGFVFFRRDAHQ